MKTVLTGILLAVVFVLCGEEFALTENGKAVSSIVLGKNATVVEKHAADELAKFLAKISNGERPSIGTGPVKGKYPIYIGLTDDEKVKEEGIKLSASKKGLYIQGKTPVGTLYGAYEILKRYGGIAWLLPGKDGEYYKVKPTIKVPEMTYIHNPDFSYRTISTVCMNSTTAIWDTWDWGLRNNMRFQTGNSTFRRQKGNYEGMMKRAICSRTGGNCFSPLLVYNPKAKTAKQKSAYQEKLFKEHPEYFPLIRGKRVRSFHGGTQPQPCTSNPEVVKIVAKNMAYQLKRAVQPTFWYFGNNDCTQWCECKNCVALDPPEESKKGIKSTRYWLFAKAVFNLVKKEFPQVRFLGNTYQTFNRFPKGTDIYRGKELKYIGVSNHTHCWKHAIDDKNCPTNRYFYEYNKEWNEQKIPIRTYEEFITAGKQFIPVEKNWVDKLKFNNKVFPSIAGMETEVCCPDGVYSKRWSNFFVLNNWEMLWQAMYLGMRFHWDVNADYDKEYEKINSLYYGKGWDGGMRKFRKLLTDLYMNASGCHGYAHSTPVGKFLDVPQAKEKLYSYLDSAEKAAAKDPDPRALKHVKRVRLFFEMTWIKEYNKYISSFRTITAYPLMGKIKIDGKLDEKDWKNADVTTRFQNSRTGVIVKEQTAVKIAYDAENIYLGIECIEPLKENQLFVETKKHDGATWEDNGIELFLNDPLMGSAYYQIIINSKDVVCDGVAHPRFDKSYESGTVSKTSFADGRFFMEIKIPARRITGGTLAAGTVLKMNIMRARRPLPEFGKNEMSTWSSGTPRSVDTFLPVTFAHPRKLISNRYIVDTRPWKNGSFDEKIPVSELNAQQRKWNFHGSKFFPKNWNPGDPKYGSEMEYLLQPGTKTNYFVRLRKGFIYSQFQFDKKELSLVFKARGKGTLGINVMQSKTIGIRKIKIDSKEWKEYKFTFKVPGTAKKRRHLMLWPQIKVGNYIDVDDVYLR